jgi:hypothetical protein
MRIRLRVAHRRSVSRREGQTCRFRREAQLREARFRHEATLFRARWHAGCLVHLSRAGVRSPQIRS